MSDDLDNFDDDLDEQPDLQDTAQQDGDKGWRKRLTNKAKTATERADAAERKLAFYEAGIDPKTDKRLTFFMDGYKGDLAPDAVKQAAIDAGFIEAEAEADDIPDAERETHKRIAGNAAGGGSTGSFDFDAQIAEAKTAGNHLRVIQLRQAQAAQVRSGRK